MLGEGWLLGTRWGTQEVDLGVGTGELRSLWETENHQLRQGLGEEAAGVVGFFFFFGPKYGSSLNSCLAGKNSHVDTV